MNVPVLHGEEWQRQSLLVDPAGVVPVPEQQFFCCWSNLDVLEQTVDTFSVFLLQQVVLDEVRQSVRPPVRPSVW